MRRRTVILAAVSRPTGGAEFESKLLDHLRALDRLARLYFGCSAVDVTIDTCRPHRAKLDFRAWEEARKTAVHLFDLETK